MNEQHFTAEILEMASEDVKKGLWCRQEWFRVGDDYPDDGRFAYGTEPPDVSKAVADADRVEDVVKELQSMQRCAEGSILFAALNVVPYRDRIFSEFCRANDEVASVIKLICNSCSRIEHHPSLVVEHNDSCMRDFDPFEAGEHLASIFQMAKARVEIFDLDSVEEE